MLGLPKLTELSKQLPKKAIYAKFQMNKVAKEKIDADISKITIVNEVSTSKVSIEAGQDVKAFFVMAVALKKKNFDERSIITISKLIPQNLIMVLQYEDKVKLAVYHTKLMQTEWKSLEELNIKLNGLDFDKVWENIIVQIGNFNIQDGNSLEEQITINEKKAKLLKDINRLEKMARAEQQPKKKFVLVVQTKKVKKELEILK